MTTTETSTAAKAPWIRIADVGQHVDQDVTLKGWLYNKRGSGKVQFLHLRDGSGFIQCVMGVNDVPDEVFERTKHLGQEAAVEIVGHVKKEERAPYIGHELAVKALTVVGESKDYPIQK